MSTRNDILRQRLIAHGYVSVKDDNGEHLRFIIDYPQFNKATRQTVPILIHKRTGVELYEESQGGRLFHIKSIDTANIPIMVLMPYTTDGSPNDTFLLINGKLIRVTKPSPEVGEEPKEMLDEYVVGEPPEMIPIYAKNHNIIPLDH